MWMHHTIWRWSWIDNGTTGTMKFYPTFCLNTTDWIWRRFEFQRLRYMLSLCWSRSSSFFYRFSAAAAFFLHSLPLFLLLFLGSFEFFHIIFSHSLSFCMLHVPLIAQWEFVVRMWKKRRKKSVVKEGNTRTSLVEWSELGTEKWTWAL